MRQAGAFGSDLSLPVEMAIVFDRASFTWGSPGAMVLEARNGRQGWGREELVLERIELTIPRGSLSVIIGEVGAGPR